jgi:DNA-binding MarR family transcriptional regulator
MPQPQLDPDDRHLFHLWKHAGEVTMTRITQAISEGTGLSGPDYGVLSRLVDLGHGELRQNDLADSMGWDKSRLSHHLTRMETRRLVARQAVGAKGVLVTITPTGKKLLTKARPVHAAAVEQHLLARLSLAQKKALLGICRALQDDEEDQTDRDDETTSTTSTTSTTRRGVV